jgi:hypothetical protein
MTQVEGLCSNLKEPRERQRLACCSSVNGGVLYLNNVQFTGGRIVSFAGVRDNNTYNLDGTSRTPRSALPAINSITRRKVKEFTLRTETKAEPLSLSNCTSYFNGTLHVLGRQTTQNLYHVCKLPNAQNDRVCPLLKHSCLHSERQHTAPDDTHRVRRLSATGAPARAPSFADRISSTPRQRTSSSFGGHPEGSFSHPVHDEQHRRHVL